MTKPRLILASMALAALAVVLLAHIPNVAGQDAAGGRRQVKG